MPTVPDPADLNLHAEQLQETATLPAAGAAALTNRPPNPSRARPGHRSEERTVLPHPVREPINTLTAVWRSGPAGRLDRSPAAASEILSTRGTVTPPATRPLPDQPGGRR